MVLVPTFCFAMSLSQLDAPLPAGFIHTPVRKDTSWQCPECMRFWGHCHRSVGCPLCKCRGLRLKMTSLCLLKLIKAVRPRRTIIAFINQPVQHLLLYCTLCRYGTSRNCRCFLCRGPQWEGPGYDGQMKLELHSDDILMRRLTTANGMFIIKPQRHRRKKAARWLYLLAGVVAMQPDYGCLTGLLIAANVGRGPHVGLLRSPGFRRLTRHVDLPIWVWRWFTALFLHYVRDRATCETRGLWGTAVEQWTHHVDLWHHD